MGDEAEVGQAALDSRFHDGGRSGVSERRAVLCQQVRELLADLPEGRENFTVANTMLSRKLVVRRRICKVPVLTLPPGAYSCES